MDKLKIICILALFCFALSPLPAIAAGENEHPDFSGNWRLNTFLSDDPIKKLSEAAIGMMRSETISEMGSPRLWRGGTGRDDVRRRGASERSEPEDTEIHVPGLNLGADALEIVHEEPLFTIRYPDGWEKSVFTDDRKVAMESWFGPVEIRARWKKKDRLVVKTTDSSGSSTTEKYELITDLGQLKVVTIVEGQRPAPSFSFTRYYDPEPPVKTEGQD